MFKAGDQVKVAGSTGTVVGNTGFSQIHVAINGETHTFKTGQLTMATTPAGCMPVIKGSLKVGSKVVTADGMTATVQKLNGSAWAYLDLKPQVRHINTLFVKVDAIAAAGNYDACTAVTKDETWTSVWKAWTLKFATTHRMAVQNYTTSWYIELNKALRSGVAAKDIKYCDRLDAALAMGATDRNMIVWRSGSSKFDTTTPIGTVFSDRGFGSTSIDSSIAFGWGSNGKVLFEIRVLAGTRGGYVDSISSCRGEAEFILPRNAQYRVVGRREEKGRIVFVVDLLGFE